MKIERMHPDDMGKLYNSTLISLQWARAWEMQHLGFDERSAVYFALLEIEYKKKLSLEIGPQRALLSVLSHEIGEKRKWSCKVRYISPPDDIADRCFHGFS